MNSLGVSLTKSPPKCLKEAIIDANMIFCYFLLFYVIPPRLHNAVVQTY